MPPTTAPALTTVPGVELARTGRWALSSGDWQPTREDFHSAVAAMSCPAIRPPRIRLGHIDPRFDGEPAVGSIANLRTEYGGHSLVGDLDEIPAWLGNRDDAGRSVLSSAFPDRSVEGTYNYRCQLGHTHPFVLTGLALLGVTPPGVGTLRSLRDVATRYGIEASPEPTDGTPVSATFRASAEVHTGAMVALVPTEEHAARLAADGGEPVEQLHLTLAYLGDAIDIDEATRRATITALATAFTGAGTVDADGFAISAFNAANDDRDTAIVLGVGGSEVDDAQSLAVQTLADVPGLVVPEQHLPFVGHVILLYSDDLSQVEQLADRCGPVAFDRLRVAFGGVFTDIPLASTVVEARFDPAQRRDSDGQWSRTGGGLRDKLKLAGRIPLDDDEYLVGSDSVVGGSGTARVAVVGFDGGQTIRLGVGNGGFGSRYDEGGPWRGGPDGTEAVNAERRALRSESDDLEAELDTDPPPDRAAAIEDRLAELHDLDINDVAASGYTAALTAEGVEELRSALSGALSYGARLQAEFDADPDADPERPENGYWILGEGSVGGDWADVHYLVYLDDPSVGVEVYLGAVPHGSGLTLDDLSNMDAAAVFDPGETGRLLRILDAAVPASVAAASDPDALTSGGLPMPVTSADAVRAAWNQTAPDAQWVTEIAPDLSYVVVVSEPDRKFTRHQVHVSAGGQITFGRGRPIRLGYVDASGSVTAQRTVYASRDESRPVEAEPPAEPDPDTPPAVEPPTTEPVTPTTPPPPGGVPVSPAAEPEPTEPKEDPVSTDLSAFRSRLGLAEDADDEAMLAAIDALKTKAETPPAQPDPALIAASAARDTENAELKKEISVLASQVATMSDELATTKAHQAATVKASVLAEAKRQGKFAPADEERWSKDYDDAPAVITRVLAAIAPGTAVPVSAAGTTGAAEPTGDDNWDAWDAEMARLSGPVSTKGN